MIRTDIKSGAGTRAVGYIRVSDESQIDGYSLDAQKAEISRWCNRHGYSIVDFYSDEGLTAHTDKISRRPELVRLLGDAPKGGFDCVVVHMLDRWARNVTVQRQALQQLGQYNIGFVSVTEDVDFTTPAGRLLMTTMGGVAEFFSDQLGLHVQKSQRQLAELGLPVGPIPFGYHRQEDKKLPPVKVDGETEVVKGGFLKRAEGDSYGEIADWLNNRGFHTREGNVFTAHAIKDMLNNRFYCGYIKYKGREYKGKHEAIVSEELFQRVQSRKQKREIIRTVHGPKGMLQGMIACAYCHNPLHSDRHRQKVPLYRERHAHECLTNNTFVVANTIDKQVAIIVFSLELDDDWKKRMAELCISQNDGPDPALLQDKRRRLGKAYADGAFTDEEYKNRLSEIDLQVQQSSNTNIFILEEAVELFSDIPMLWSEATTDERRKLLGTLVEKVYIDMKTKKVTAIRPTPAFRALFGVGINTTPEAPIGLLPLEEGTGGIVGHGGDGGESNSPSRKGCQEYATGIAGFFILPGQPQPAGYGRTSRYFFRRLYRRPGGGTPAFRHLGPGPSERGRAGCASLF